MGLKKWKENMEKKNSLKRYKVKEKPTREYIYDGTWESSLLFKARTDSLEVNEKKKRWGGQIDWCEKCGNTEENRQIETLEHLLTECSGYEEERNKFNEILENKMGKEEWTRLKTRNDKGLKIILGLEGEKKEIIEDTKRYLKEVWRKRNMKERRRGRRRVDEHNYTRRNEGS